MDVNDKNTEAPASRLDLAEIKEKLRGKSGKAYWRSLDEIADTKEFQLYLEDEFPNRSTLLQIRTCRSKD